MPISNSKLFDIAIIGAGCAGLTLANLLSVKTNHSIAIFDERTSYPEHFWGFWDNGSQALNMARSISQKKWHQWSIRSNNEEVVHEGSSTVYRAISSNLFENKIWEALSKNEKFERFNTNVRTVNQQPEQAIIHLANGQYSNAKAVFDSRPIKWQKGMLLQHFLGLTVKSEKKIFNASKAILMDFRVTQEEGIHFIYLLPFCEKTALIESTVFSQNTKERIWYRNEIQKYLSKFYGCNNFRIQNTEAGIIPMHQLTPNTSLGIPIGLRAEASRSSSGYAFAQIQNQMWNLACSIEKRTKPNIKPGCDQFEKIMDTLMLKVITEYPNDSIEVFIKAFKSLSGDQFADFMNGYSRWSSRFRLIAGLPKKLFIKGMIN